MWQDVNFLGEKILMACFITQSRNTGSNANEPLGKWAHCVPCIDKDNLKSLCLYLCLYSFWSTDKLMYKSHLASLNLLYLGVYYFIKYNFVYIIFWHYPPLEKHQVMNIWILRIQDDICEHINSYSNQPIDIKYEALWRCITLVVYSNLISFNQ